MPQGRGDLQERSDGLPPLQHLVEESWGEEGEEGTLGLQSLHVSVFRDTQPRIGLQMIQVLSGWVRNDYEWHTV